MENIACNLCGARNEQFLFYGYDIDYHTGEEQFRLVRCVSCGLVYINPRPEEKEMKNYFPDSYRPHHTKHTKESLFYYQEPLHPERRVLDVGCGSGELLESIAEREKNTALYGVDIDERAVAASRASGFPVIHGTLFDAHYPDSYFDEIHMIHMLEHVQDQKAVLREAARILKPAGVLKIEVPNFHNISRIIFGNKWKRLDMPRHLYHFTSRTLTVMLQRAGFSRSTVTGIASPKYFLQSFAFWWQGKKQSYPRFVWYFFTPPARLAALLGISSTMRAVVRK